MSSAESSVLPIGNVRACRNCACTAFAWVTAYSRRSVSGLVRRLPAYIRTHDFASPVAIGCRLLIQQPRHHRLGVVARAVVIVLAPAIASMVVSPTLFIVPSIINSIMAYFFALSA